MRRLQFEIRSPHARHALWGVEFGTGKDDKATLILGVLPAASEQRLTIW